MSRPEFARRRAAAAVTILTVVATGVLAAPALAASDPAPVTNLALSTTDGVVYADWTPSPDTTSANLCWKVDTAPTTPSDPAATCSGVLASPGYSFPGVDGTTYGVSVFAYDSAS